MGVSIAIDAFGTGFSSLSYFAKLPVDTLKIDRSFVIDMTGGPQGLALVSTIISLAHSLNLKAVAEGIETEELSRLLQLLRCDEIQGFLIQQASASRELRGKIPGSISRHMTKLPSFGCRTGSLATARLLCSLPYGLQCGEAPSSLYDKFPEVFRNTVVVDGDPADRLFAGRMRRWRRR